VRSLSDRDMPERLIERGIDVTDEAIRTWRLNKCTGKRHGKLVQ
jgi:transposase-like protein